MRCSPWATRTAAAAPTGRRPANRPASGAILSQVFFGDGTHAAQANGVATDGTDLYVVGQQNSALGGQNVLLLHYTVAAPQSRHGAGLYQRNNATFSVGSAATFTISATGSPKPALTETGALPSGVTFTDNGNGTATLAGTPTSAGGYNFTITASNGVAPTPPRVSP